MGLSGPRIMQFFAQIGTMSRTVSAGARLRGYRGAPVEPLPPLAPDGNVFRPMLRPLRSSIGDRLSLKEDAAAYMRRAKQLSDAKRLAGALDGHRAGWTAQHLHHNVWVPSQTLFLVAF